MVVDMSCLKRIEVDVESGTALVEPGVNTLELRNATKPYGLHFPGGHISPVGISGFILGEPCRSNHGTASESSTVRYVPHTR